MTTKFYKSKTIWAAFLLPVLALVSPGVRDWASANPEALITIISIIFGVLRTITKGKLDLGISNDDDVLSDLPPYVKAPK